MNLFGMILATTSFLLLAKLNNAISEEETWNKWNCEDLTFDECQLDVVEGDVDVRGLKVHYWKYSRPNFAADATDSLPLSPIIFIHGGPSLPHNYALPLKKQACGGRDVVFYDQAGCGKSLIKNTPEDENIYSSQYSWLLDINYYATEELPALIDHLGYPKFHIIGHSWGSMVAQVFALDGRIDLVDGIQSLTLSGPKSDINLFSEAQWDPIDGTITQLPAHMQKRIRELQSARKFESDEYVAIVDTYCTLFLTRTQPIPNCVAESFSGVNTNIYYGIFGMDEFSIRGAIKDFNITSRLHEIEVPVLLTSGQYDDVRPKVVGAIEKELKNVERVVFLRAAHLSMIDEPDRYNEVVQDFLDRVEQALVKDEKFKPKIMLHDEQWMDEKRFTLNVLIGSCVGTLIVGTYVGFLIYRWNQEYRYSIPRTNSGTLKKDY